MKIGDKFTFNSHGVLRKALFLSKDENNIYAIICDEKLQGLKVKINKKQIIKT